MIDVRDLNLVITLAAELWDADGVLAFLRAPHPMLRDRTALDVLDQDGTDLILVVLDALASGAVM